MMTQTGKINFSELYDQGLYVLPPPSYSISKKLRKAAKARLANQNLKNDGITTFEAFLKSIYKPKEEEESDGEEEGSVGEEDTSEDEYAFLYDTTEIRFFLITLIVLWLIHY